MPKYGPMGPPVARARPARAHVVASEHARAMERHRAAVAFEQRHEGAVSSPEKSAYAFQPPPWVESASPPRSGTQARASGRGTPALTHAQLDAALAVADALRADGLSDDAERVLRTVLKTDPGNARAAEGLRKAGAAETGVSAAGLSGRSDDAPVTRGRGRARVPRDERPGALGAYGVPKPPATKATSKNAKRDDVSVEPLARDFVVRLDLRYADDADSKRDGDTRDTRDEALLTGAPRWSEVERPVLFDRLPEPPKAKVPGKPPPPVTRAELDEELFAKRERLAKERELERREAVERERLVKERERLEDERAREEKTARAYAHRDALRAKAADDRARERLAREEAARADAAEVGTAGVPGDVPGMDAPVKRTGKKLLGGAGRRPSPFAAGR